MAEDCSHDPVVLLRVLVADSGASVNEGLVALLSEFDGLNVFGCAQDPAMVLALISALEPDVVLLDLQADERVGLRMLRAIKSLSRPPIVLALSHNDLPPVRDAALAAGADRVLPKTAACEQLHEILRDLSVRPGFARRASSGELAR